MPKPVVPWRVCLKANGTMKVPLSEADAQRWQVRMNWKLDTGELSGDRFSAYPCPMCGHWHCGRRRRRTDCDRRRERRHREAIAQWAAAVNTHHGGM